MQLAAICQARPDKPQIVAVARAKHHPMLAERDRLRVPVTCETCSRRLSIIVPLLHAFG
jgi:hypothetical protein